MKTLPTTSQSVVKKFAKFICQFLVLFTNSLNLFAASAAQNCEAVLDTFSQRGVTLVSARLVPRGDNNPDFCQVAGQIIGNVGFEVRMPIDWNGRFYMVGNEGNGGQIAVRNMARPLELKYATASTDQGYDVTTEGTSRYGYNNREKEINFGYRAVHVTAEASKQVVANFYGKPAAYSYFYGGSAGGRAALMAAQRFPGDFDGILLAAPTINISLIQMWAIWKAKALSGDGYFSPEKLPALSKAVFSLCDDLDGVTDGVIDNPIECKFEPAKHLAICPVNTDNNNCFTAAQIKALEMIYGGVRNSQGEVLFDGQPPGAEAPGTQPPWVATEPSSAWDGWITTLEGEMSTALEYGEAFMKYTAFDVDDPNYNWSTFDFDKDPARMAGMQAILDAANPDLSSFRASNGKMLHYHHWADTAVPPLNSLKYFKQVQDSMGNTDDFYKLYMVPGGFHGAQGVGAVDVDWLDVLVNWVENDLEPGEMVARRTEDGKVVRSRKVCPYPYEGKYKGAGDTDSAENFHCIMSGE